MRVFRPQRSLSFVVKVCLICAIVTFVYYYVLPQNDRHQNWQEAPGHQDAINHADAKEYHHESNGNASSRHVMCVLIPFRDRFDELTEFVPRITHFLINQNVMHKIFAINQVRITVIYGGHNMHKLQYCSIVIIFYHYKCLNYCLHHRLMNTDSIGPHF